ncbi:prevent-host-death protein [Rhizobium sp. LCM 4573]|nr:prevent-host-death protein [Rhizobium sp. LCM 4573]
MKDRTISSVEFVRHFGRYHDEAMREPIVLTKHGRASVVVMPVELYERMSKRESDPRRAYGQGEIPGDLADMFLTQLEQDSADYQATKDD